MFKQYLTVLIISSVLALVACGCGSGPTPDGRTARPSMLPLPKDTSTVPVDTSLQVSPYTVKPETANTMTKAIYAKKSTSKKTARVQKSLPQKALAKKQPVHTSPKVETIQDTVDFDKQPRTREEARDWSFAHYKAAQRQKDAQKALKHVERGLSLYENGSLYVLKARVLNRVGMYAAAKNAADRALPRTDFWRPENKQTARAEKIIALENAYKETPSTILKRELDAAKMAH